MFHLGKHAVRCVVLGLFLFPFVSPFCTRCGHLSGSHQLKPSRSAKGQESLTVTPRDRHPKIPLLFTCCGDNQPRALTWPPAALTAMHSRDVGKLAREEGHAYTDVSARVTASLWSAWAGSNLAQLTAFLPSPRLSEDSGQGAVSIFVPV